MKYKILIIEDESQIRDVVGKYLKKEGYEIYLAENGIEGLATFSKFSPHLVVLDVMMPGISGFDVLKEVRLFSEVPVIMLTAKQTENDRIEGFDLGADDYVPKPFSPKELVRRANAVIKRVYSAKRESLLLVAGDFVLDTAKQKLFKKDKEIEITSKEFEILKVFLANEKVVLSRNQLIEKAFGYDYDGFDRNVDTYIKNIRQKIEEDSRNPKYLKTKYGAGYIFEGGRNDG